MIKQLSNKLKKRLQIIRLGIFPKDRFGLFIWAITFYLPYPIFLINKFGAWRCFNSTSIWMSQEYANKTIKELIDIKEGTFVDVGACIGTFTIMIANQLKNKGKVIAFEPEKKNYNALIKNINLNMIKNVQVLNKGAYSKNGLLDFYLNDSIGEHSLYKKTNHKIKVEVVKIDDVIKDNDIKIIKIDVEGAEKEVILGGLETIKRNKPLIIFEAWNNEAFLKVRDVLNPLGYSFEQIENVNYIAIPKMEIKK